MSIWFLAFLTVGFIILICLVGDMERMKIHQLFTTLLSSPE